MKKIPLTQGKFTLVDDADYVWLSQWKWYALKDHNRNRWYAVHKLNGKTVYMHRLILGIKDGHRIDHQDGGGLDNRRQNLRVATQRQNLQNRGRQWNNTSGFKGVSPSFRSYRLRKPWRVRIKAGGKHHFIGRYASKEEAARAYDVAALRFFGKFARLNFPRRRRAA